MKKTSAQHSKEAVLLLFLCCCYTLSVAQWSYRGLAHAGKTTHLTSHQDTLYASTYDGIYKKHVLSQDTTWWPCGLQGNHVVQTLVPDHQHFICVVEIGTTQTTQLYRSANGGATFTLMHPDTSDYNSYQYLNAVAHPEENYDTLYFLNHHLKTYDGGLTWDTLASFTNFVNRCIKVNPVNTQQLIIGGETWILSPFVQLSPDNGTNWYIPNMIGYFAGDNCVHDLVIDSTNTWTAAGEGVICRTTDGGNTWTQLLNVWSWPQAWGLYMWDIEVSPADRNKLYVTGSISSGGSRIPLFYSQNNGATWDTLSTAAMVSPPSINCLAVKNSPSGDQVFLGGNGVYVYQNNFAGRPSPEGETPLTVSPNPFSAATTVHVNQVLRAGTLTICTLYGQVVKRMDQLSGQTIHLQRDQLPAGTYLVHLSQDALRWAPQKIVITD